MSIGVFALWILAILAMYFGSRRFASRYLSADTQFDAGWIAGGLLVLAGFALFAGH